VLPQTHPTTKNAITRQGVMAFHFKKRDNSKKATTASPDFSGQRPQPSHGGRGLYFLGAIQASVTVLSMM
jgi:hypothetical protein